MFPWPVSVLLLASALLAQDTPTFRADVRLVNVVTTVRNEKGDLVGTLQKEDFEIRDNGVAQEIRYFGRQTDQPLSVALLVDTSGSTARSGQDHCRRQVPARTPEGHPGRPRRPVLSMRHPGAALPAIRPPERELKMLKGKPEPPYDASFRLSPRIPPGPQAIVIMTDGGDTVVP
jgi:Ca-activated chloride channel family protein